MSKSIPTRGKSFILLPAKLLLIFFIIFVVVLIVVKTIDYFTPEFSEGYLSDKALVFYGVFRYGFYAHIISAPIAILIGTVQWFFKKSINHSMHRLLGKFYVLLILFFSVPGALVLSWYSFGGVWSKLSFFILTGLWGVFTFMAYKSILMNDIKRHANFMLRSYVLSLSAITLRVILFVAAYFYNLSGEVVYTVIAWLSWLPLWIVVEVYLFLRSYKDFKTI